MYFVGWLKGIQSMKQLSLPKKLFVCSLIHPLMSPNLHKKGLDALPQRSRNLSTLSILKCHHTCQQNITERSAPQSVLLLRPPGRGNWVQIGKCYSWVSTQLKLKPNRIGRHGTVWPDAASQLGPSCVHLYPPPTHDWLKWVIVLLFSLRALVPPLVAIAFPAWREIPRVMLCRASLEVLENVTDFSSSGSSLGYTLSWKLWTQMSTNEHCSDLLRRDYDSTD